MVGGGRSSSTNFGLIMIDVALIVDDSLMYDWLWSGD